MQTQSTDRGKATKNLESVLNPYFIPVKTFIDNLTKDWGGNLTNIDGLKYAMEFLYKTIHYSQDQLEVFLDKELGSDEKFKDLRSHCVILSKLCNGNMDDNPKMIENCQALHLEDEQLKVAVSGYFQEKCRSYLIEKYPEEYSKNQAIKDQFEAFLGASHKRLGAQSPAKVLNADVCSIILKQLINPEEKLSVNQR